MYIFIQSTKFNCDEKTSSNHFCLLSQTSLPCLLFEKNQVTTMKYFAQVAHLLKLPVLELID